MSSRIAESFLGGLILVLLVALGAGCGSPRRGEPLEPALALTSPSLEQGRLVFMQKCNLCHPGGEGGLGPALNNKPLSRGMIKLQVRSGFGVMPAFDDQQINPQQLKDLADYLVALRKS